jgi:hypothetical protein
MRIDRCEVTDLVVISHSGAWLKVPGIVAYRETKTGRQADWGTSAQDVAGNGGCVSRKRLAVPEIKSRIVARPLPVTASTSSNNVWPDD